MMTHNYPLDLLLLPRILPLRPRYLGILGPRERAREAFFRFGVELSPPCVHAPAGLDAGCDSPEAIALSIVAEIQAETNSRPGGKLKYRREPIHLRPTKWACVFRAREQEQRKRKQPQSGPPTAKPWPEAMSENAAPKFAVILLAAGNSTRMGAA